MKNLFQMVRSSTSLKRKSLDPLLRQFHLQRTPEFWQWQEQKQRIQSWFANHILRFQKQRLATSDDIASLRDFSRAILPKLFRVIVVVVALEVIENSLKSLPSLFANWPIIESDIYLGLATTVVGLAGTFIALYFTALTVVAGTIYSDVADDVRRLLIEERFGNFYFRVVAFLGVVAVLIVAALAFGYVPGIFNLGLIILFATFSIFSFVVLGLKTLQFFNPTQLLHYLDRDFSRWLLSSTPDGFMWSDQSFQQDFQQQAEKSLSTYRNVMTLITSEEGMGIEPVTKTVNHALALLKFNAYHKLRVPTESYWFRRMGEFQDWLLAEDFVVGIALNTGTTIQQKPVPNPLWVEEHVSDIIQLGIEKHLNNQDWQNAFLTIDQWQNTLGIVSYCWGLEEANFLHSKLKPIIGTMVARSDETWLQKDDYKELGQRLGILDVYQLAHIQIVLSFSKKLEQISVQAFEEIFAKIDWAKPGSIYETGFPRSIVIQLEYLKKNLELEYKAEGQLITPLWYIQQFIVAEFAKYIVQSIRQLIIQVEQEYIREAEKLIEDKSMIFAAQTCGRGIEAVAKGKLCLHEAKTCLDQLRAYIKPFGFHLINAKYPEINWLEKNQELDDIRDRLIILESKSIAILMQLPKSRFLPDMFGRVTTELANACFNSLLEKKAQLFHDLFQAYFTASYGAHQRLSEQLKDHQDWIRFELSMEPVIDLMEISGYAIVCTELGFGDFWNYAKPCWDTFFSDATLSNSRVKILEAFIDYKESRFRIMQHDFIRTGWRQIFNAEMQSIGILSDWLFRYSDKRSQLEQYSPIAQVALGGNFHNLYDVFLAVYFDERSPAPNFELPHKAKEFRRQLQKIQQKSPSGEILQ